MADLKVQPLANQPTLAPRPVVAQPQVNLSVQPVAPQPTVTPARLPQQPSLGTPLSQPQNSGQITSIGDAQTQAPFEGKMPLDAFAKLLKEKYPQYAEIPDEELAYKVIEKYPQYKEKVSVTEPPTPEEPGLLQRLAQGLAGSALGRIPLSGIRAGAGLIDFAQGLGLKGAQGLSNLVGNEDNAADLEYRANEKLNAAGRNLNPDRPTDLGYFGQVKPISTPDFTHKEDFSEGAKKFRDNAGIGLDTASYAIGGEGAAGVVANGLKGQVLRGGLEGLGHGIAAGGIQGLGSGLQQEDASVGSVAKDAGLGALGGGALGGILGAASPVAGKLGRAGLEAVFPSLKEGSTKFASVVDNYFNRTFKPSTAGIKTPAALEKAQQDARLGIATIIDNLPDPSITPKTVDEALAANTAAKKSILDAYKARSTAAGEAGATIDLAPIADELEKLAKDPKIQIVSPGTTDYAADLALRLRSQEKIDPSMAEDFLAGFNARSKAYWANPNPNEINNVLVDTLVGNNLRQGLSDVVNTTLDGNYNFLRKQYGALSELEKTLTKAAARLQNKQAVGFFDGLGNILAAGDILEGVLTGSPTQAARGFVTKGVGKVLKSLNDPDRLTAKMFKEASKAFTDDILPKASPKFMKSLPAPQEGSANVANNVPIEVPNGGFKLPPDAAELQAGLTRIGGKGSRRYINKGILGEDAISAPAIKRGSYAQTKAMKGREFARVVSPPNLAQKAAQQKLQTALKETFKDAPKVLDKLIEDVAKFDKLEDFLAAKADTQISEEVLTDIFNLAKGLTK